jgi:AcrR family transcriptional regulator
MAPKSVEQAKRRLSRADWVGAALEAIGRRGLAGVAVEPLAGQLGVTKGSFYAHFSSRDELIDAALDRWEQSHGGADLERFGAIEDPAERLRAILLAAITFSQSGAPSVHVRLLGELGDERVRRAVDRVNDARTRLLTRSYRQLGLSPQRAGYRARLAYATYLGLLLMAREAPDRRLRQRDIARFIAEVESALATP